MGIYRQINSFDKQGEAAGGTRILRNALLVSASFAVLATAPVHAQQAADGDFGIEEIVVTARRREERLQDVPITIAAFSYEDLQAQNNNDTFDIADSVPGLQIHSSYYGRAPVIYIRGVGINDVNQNFNGPVSIYFDEVFMSSPVGGVSQMFDLERIEVLKGPQGTLFGKNTTGGAITLHSRLPGDETSGNFSATYGRYNEIDIQAAMTVPLAPGTLSARVAIASKDRDGVAKNFYDPANPGNFTKAISRDNDIDNLSGRAILRFTPNDNFEALVIFNMTNGRSDESQKQPVQLFDAFGNILQERAPTDGTDALGYNDPFDSPFKFISNQDVASFIDTFGVTLIMDWEGPDFGVKSISSYQEADHFGLEDVFTDPDDILDIHWKDEQNQISQELQVYSTAEGPFNWIGGVHYFKEDLDVDNVFEFFFLKTEFGGPGANLNQVYQQDIESWAVFGELDYDLSDSLTLTGGLRWTSENRVFNRASLGIDADAPITRRTRPASAAEGAAVFFPFVPEAREEKTWSRITSRAALNYRVNDDNMIWASMSKGFKSGGWSGGGLFEPEEFGRFSPETLISYEAGWKSTWYDDKLRFNLSTFFYDYKNLQVFTFFSSPDGRVGNVTENASDAEVLGVDMEIKARPTPEWDLDFGVAFLPKAEYVNYIGTGPDGEVQEFSGNRLQSAARWNVTAATQYTIPLGPDMMLSARLEGFLNSQMHFSTANLARMTTEGTYIILNTRLTVAHANGAQLALWVDNLTDKIITTDRLDLSFVGADQRTTNVHTTYGVTLSYAF